MITVYDDKRNNSSNAVDNGSINIMMTAKIITVIITSIILTK